MHEVGSEAWLAAFAAVAATVDVEPGAEAVVQHELTDGGASWHVVVAGGRVDVRQGRHPAPDVTFTEDRATAAAIAAGELSAQQAFVDGRLRVRGAVGRLTGAVADALASLPPLGR